MGIGISDHHIAGIQSVAVKNNFFLFIRPTEDDSLRLIDAGYATKSMDIHDKSSNWGPMAGFVPCDKAFCKVPDGATPQAAFVPHDHGLAHPVQLTLNAKVISQFEGSKIRRLSKAEAAIAPQGLIPAGPAHVPANFTTGHTMRGGELPSLFQVYKALGAPPGIYGDIYFVIDAKYRVWWVDMGTGPAPARVLGVAPPRQVTMRPLWVWAYDVAGGRLPVTGDYDIWALVPHVSTLKDLSDHTIISVDKKDHGNSAASEYFKRIADELNTACGRAGNTVFNHGAEAQNYGFTQKHDAEILMVPPVNDTSRVRKVSIGDMTKVLAEIQHAGYLVLLNRQWTVERPKLMGKELPEVLVELKDLRVAALHEAVAASRTQGNTDPRRQQIKSMWQTAASAGVAADRHEASSKLEPQRAMIKEWYGKLRAALDDLGRPLEVLATSDFPSTYRKASDAAHQLQAALEKTATAHMMGGGENDRARTRRALADQEPAMRELMAFWGTPA
ncbi:MAG: hypothetical protein KC620_03400 [Myxococcales bacterium]|nr:hypothetical protein [Myxococcales bacterium]